MSVFLRLLCCELRLALRHKNEWASLVLFFVIVLLLLPFAIGPDPGLLQRLAPGLIWLAALLMNLLALDRLFVADARDGTLDLMLLSPLPLPVILFAKLLVQIIIMLAALAIMLLPASVMLGMGARLLPVLLLSLALGVPVLMLLGGIAAAITVALERGAALLILLLVPFYIPVIVFAVGACDAALTGGSIRPNLLLLAALLVLLLPSAPFIAAAALRNAQG